MMDRLVFLASRFLWPLHSLMVLTAVGIVFGARGVADYTYALALCTPLYFLIGFSFPIFLLVDSRQSHHNRALVWIRILSACATIPIFAIASVLLLSTQANVVFAVWLLKVGELLFDPLPTLLAAESADSRRGRRLLTLDMARVTVAQGVMWYAMLGAEWGIVRTLALVGACSIVMNMLLLITVPNWERRAEFLNETFRALRRMRAQATSMTVSGALLAFLVSLPRLLADPALNDNERALFGVAQVLGTGAAILFNSIWLYELHRIRTALADAHVGKVLRKNLVLSGLFCGALTIGAVVLIVVQSPLLALLRISTVPSMVLPVLFAALAFQHCMSIYRDTLKFTGQQWRETQVLVQALVAATVTFYLLAYVIQVPWLVTVVAMCAVASGLQVVISIYWLMQHGQEGRTASPQTIA
jgi:hypothetical protein